jgi:hypothetical protein
MCVAQCLDLVDLAFDGNQKAGKKTDACKYNIESGLCKMLNQKFINFHNCITSSKKWLDLVQKSLFPTQKTTRRSFAMLTIFTSKKNAVCVNTGSKRRFNHFDIQSLHIHIGLDPLLLS